ncbi:MAG: nucleoside triphosphate pyrophosphohydrolase [Deltaproteobacteria bacterium]|nr:nucleoside triphosphate pyrophosphohydrolase [Deltaproteobacteria bacterium]
MARAARRGRRPARPPVRARRELRKGGRRGAPVLRGGRRAARDRAGEDPGALRRRPEDARLQARLVVPVARLPLPAETGALFLELLAIVEKLRSPEGCPWDREQTPASIAPYLLEEAHEVAEAIEEGDHGELCVELGDVLLEVALLAEMAREDGRFTAADSLRAIRDKLIRRHPHVFGGERVSGASEVRESWARIKAAEKAARGVLEGVPRRLPALHRARRVSERAAGVGFDWEDAAGVFRKVEEELAELQAASRGKSPEAVAGEVGDVLFAVVNLARHLGVDPEAALHGTTEKFLARFAHMESALRGQGRSVSEADAAELDARWEEAKRALAPRAPAEGEGAEEP